jgi:hypothetical protein
MRYLISESQSKKLETFVQELIDLTLDSIRDESEEWGLGEMSELHELDSIDKIVIDRMVNVIKPKVYVNVYSNTDNDNFDNTTSELQYRISEWIPNIEFYINEIIYI